MHKEPLPSRHLHPSNLTGRQMVQTIRQHKKTTESFRSPQPAIQSGLKPTAAHMQAMMVNSHQAPRTPMLLNRQRMLVRKRLLLLDHLVRQPNPRYRRLLEVQRHLSQTPPHRGLHRHYRLSSQARINSSNRVLSQLRLKVP